MSLLWQQEQAGVLYEVRQAGSSLRLYSNGVLHSQFNPQRKVTGSVWDLLSLPALFLPLQQIQRVLVLGVGGGAVLQQLKHWFSPGLLLGVELNPLHIYVAEQFFQLKDPDILLYQDDASLWLRRYQGPPFDIIIDDLYGHEQGEPVRAIGLDDPWCQLLSEHVAADGLLVVNTVSWQELKASALLDAHNFQGLFRDGFRLTTPNCDNAVGVFSKQTISKNDFNRRLQQQPELNAAMNSGLLRYQMRRLKA